MSFVKRMLAGEQVVFQIFGAFEGDWLTTSALFAKGQMMGDGVTLQEAWERQFHEGEGEEFKLMLEFTVPDIGYASDEDVWRVARAINHAYWKGWFESLPCPDDDDEEESDEHVH